MSEKPCHSMIVSGVDGGKNTAFGFILKFMDLQRLYRPAHGKATAEARESSIVIRFT